MVEGKHPFYCQDYAIRCSTYINFYGHLDSNLAFLKIVHVTIAGSDYCLFSRLSCSSLTTSSKKITLIAPWLLSLIGTNPVFDDSFLLHFYPNTT